MQDSDEIFDNRKKVQLVLRFISNYIDEGDFAKARASIETLQTRVEDLRDTLDQYLEENS